MTNAGIKIHAPKQDGAALVVSLVLVLVMTMLGVSTAKMTVTGERMAGHFFNKQSAFDAAEASLRAGELAMDALAVHAPTDGTAGLYSPNPTAAPIWETATTNWQTRPGTALPRVATQPVYVAEFYGGVPRDDNCGLDAETSTSSDCWRYVYRVSARGWGANTTAVSTTQSTILMRK